jgi:hypothetical protein
MLRTIGFRVARGEACRASGEPIRQRKSARALSEIAITAGFRIFLSTVIA